MIIEVLSAGLVISACLAIFFEEAVYSVAALAGTFFLTALVFTLSGALYVAIFQFAVGVGTLAVLFLSGEMLSEKSQKKTPPKSVAVVLFVGILLSFPAIFFSIPMTSATGYGISFAESLWTFRAPDVVLQGLVMMTVAVGIAIVLYDRKKGER